MEGVNEGKGERRVTGEGKVVNKRKGDGRVVKGSEHVKKEIKEEYWWT